MEMKKFILLVGMLFFLMLSLRVFASSSPSKQVGTISLDQFHDVAFEQFSSNAFSLNLLQAKKLFDPQGLVFGGMGELDLQHWYGDYIPITDPTGSYQNNTVLYFTVTTADVMVNVNSWSTIFLSGAVSSIGQGGVNGNYYYSPRAFLLFGNIEKFPLFLTAGINSIPFGQFTGAGVWNKSLTQDYFYPQQAPQLNLAYHQEQLDLSAAIFRDQILFENHSVYTLRYNNTIDSWRYGVGVGCLTRFNFNLTGSPPLNRKAIEPSDEFDTGTISDINATLGYKLLTLSGEYLRGSRTVNFNNSQPNALSFTVTYTPTLFGIPYSFGVNYSKTNELANIPASLPGQDQLALANAGLKNAWAINASRNFTKWFVLGLDVERDVIYGNQHTYAYTLDLSVYL